jgi:hypothetical protein
VDPQYMPMAEGYLSFDMGFDALQSQNRTKGYRALSWPGDCPYLEQSDEGQVPETEKQREQNEIGSRQSSPPRNKNSHITRGRDHTTTGVRTRVRVPCSYGNGCRQTFNRKTDLDRHINTVSRR